MPDGYCSNFANCIDMKSAKFQNMKSHDCHVFLQMLMPIAFLALPDDVLELELGNMLGGVRFVFMSNINELRILQLEPNPFIKRVKKS